MSEPHEFIRDIQTFAQNIVDTVREPLLILDADLRAQFANRAYYRVFQVTPDATLGRHVYELGDGQWGIPALRTMLESVIPENSTFDDFEVEQTFPGVGHKAMILNARKVYRPGNHTGLLILAMEDVTERRAAQQELQATLDRLQADNDRQRRIAQALQRPLLLEVAEDAFPNLSVATLYSSAWEESEVGGDFFNVFPLADDRVVFLLGDASGKGLSAAARATEVKDVLRAFLRLYPYYPAQTLSRLNDYLCDAESLDHRAGDNFIALSLVVISHRRSEAIIAWGGIEPPLVLRASGKVEVTVGGGLPLGVSAKEVYAETTINFRKGDTIVMTTDGLSEARQGKEFFGQEGVIDALMEAQGARSLREMGEAILGAARSFAGGSLSDDACMVLVRRR